MKTKTIIGEIFPDPISEILHTNYGRFYSAAGIDGLAKVTEKRLDLLAVAASFPGHGHFRNFIQICQSEFDTICVWHVENPLLQKCLPKYGFTPETEIDSSGEVLEGYRWDKTI